MVVPGFLGDTHTELFSPPARTHSGQPESSEAKLLLLTYQEGRPQPENGAAYIACSVMFQHLMWYDSSRFVAHPSPHYYAMRWAVTRREFTLALAHKASLLVRRSGSQHHLIMVIAHGTHAIARGMALHKTAMLFSSFCSDLASQAILEADSRMPKQAAWSERMNHEEIC